MLLFVITLLQPLCATAFAEIPLDEVGKPNKLDVLLLFPETLIPVNVKTFPMLSNLIAAICNARKDILPAYRITITVKDEVLGRMSTYETVKYYRESSESTSISPLILGPLFSTGCRHLGKTLHHLDMVSLSPLCASPILWDRLVFPNLYLMIPTFELISTLMLKFVREIGTWNRIAILSQIINEIDASSSMLTLRKARRERFSVDFTNFHQTSMSEEDLDELKKSDVRIIMYFQSYHEELHLFLCRAFYHGLTGKKYLFLLNLAIRLSVYETNFEDKHQGCTTSVLIEQYKISYWFGVNAVQGNFTSELGYNFNQLQVAMLEYSNGNFSIHESDFKIFLFHDTALRALLALNDTETILNSKHNLTLSDYSTFPDIVAKATKEALLAGKISGLEHGVMSFSKAGQSISGNLVVAISHPNSSLKEISTFNQLPNSPDFELSSYVATEPVLCYPLPALDKRMEISKFKAPPNAVFIIVAVISATLIIISLTLSGNLILQPNRKFSIWKLIILFYSITLGISSVLFILEPGSHSKFTWILVHVVGLIAISGVSIMMSVRCIYTFHEFSYISATIASAQISGNQARMSLHGRKRVIEVRIQDSSWSKIALNSPRISLLANMALSIIIIAIFLVWSPECGFYIHEENYDDYTDIFEQIWQYQCYNPKLYVTFGVVCCANLLLTCIGSFYAYKAAKQFEKCQELAEAKAMKLSQGFLLMEMVYLISLALIIVTVSGDSITQAIVSGFLALYLAVAINTFVFLTLK